MAEAPASVRKESKVETLYVVPGDKAKALVNEHLVKYVGSSFISGEPEILKTLDSVLWKVPIFLAYSSRGVVGKAGDYFVDAATVDIVSVTTREALMKNAEALATKLGIACIPLYMFRHLTWVRSWRDLRYSVKDVIKVLGHVKDFAR